MIENKENHIILPNCRRYVRYTSITQKSIISNYYRVYQHYYTRTTPPLLRLLLLLYELRTSSGPERGATCPSSVPTLEPLPLHPPGDCRSTTVFECRLLGGFLRPLAAAVPDILPLPTFGHVLSSSVPTVLPSRRLYLCRSHSKAHQPAM